MPPGLGGGPTVARAQVAIGAWWDKGSARRTFKTAERDIDRHGKSSGRKFAEGFEAGGVSGLAPKLVSSFAGAFQLSAKTLATGFSLQFTGAVAAGLASGVAKMAHGLGALAALVPAAAGAGLLAFGSLGIAVAGVGDALSAGLAGDTEKFAEALKGLSPAARGFAREVAAMRDEIKDLKSSVQEKFFAEFSGQTRKLGAVYLPMLRSSLGSVSTSFGQAVRKAAGLLQTPRVVLSVKAALGNMSGAVGNVAAGLVGLVRAFIPLVTVGSSFLPKLTAGFGNATDRLAKFMEHAEDTGRLADFIQRGLDKLHSLVDTGRQVWRVIKNVVAIFSMFGGFGGIFSALGIKTGGLLDSLEELTTKAREFFATSEGGKAMAQIVTTIRQLLNASMGMFAKLVAILAPFFPQIAEFATAVENLMTGIVDAAQPAIEMFLRDLLPAITSVVNFLTDHTPILQGLLIGLFAAWAAGAIAAAIPTIAAALPFIAIGVAVAALAALIIANWDTIKNVSAALFGWITDHWKILLIVLTGGLGAAVVFIVDHWDTIKNAAATVWNWITDHWRLLFDILVGPFGFAVLWIVEHWNGLVEFVKGLPDLISAAASGMWEGLKSGLVAVVNWIIRQLNRIHFTIPGWVPGVGGKSFGIDLPQISIGGGGGGGTPAPPHVSGPGGGGGVPTFQTGGILPGFGPMSVIAHGGEAIFNRRQQANLFALATDPRRYRPDLALPAAIDRGSIDNSTTINVGPVVINVPPGVDAAWAGREAAKAFKKVLQERKIITDSRIT